MAKLKVNEVEATSTNEDVSVITKGSTGALEIKGNSSNDGTLQLNCSAQSHGVKLKAPTNNADLGYTMTLPDNQIAAGKLLKVKSVTNNNAQLEYADVPPNDLTSTPLNADNLTSGTIAPARIPDFPASNGFGLKLIQSQTVTASSVNSIIFTGLTDNTAYHVVVKHMECTSNTSAANFYLYPLNANGSRYSQSFQGMYMEYASYVGGYRNNGGYSQQSHIELMRGEFAYDGPIAGHMDFYTGNWNSVIVNNTTRNGMWGQSNFWGKGFYASNESWFSLNSNPDYHSRQIHGIEFAYSSSSYYIKPNVGCTILLYQYMET